MHTENKASHAQFDIILYGATSFVGKLTAAYLQRHLLKINKESTTFEKDTIEQPRSLRWAIAGRNEDKLNALKQQLGNETIPIVLANSDEPETLDAMCAKTNVIISTVGPYIKYGEPLIKACVDNGTDYVDLTGESIFIKNMMNKYSEDAKKSGARIVNCCGFDSIPFDLGVLYTQNQAKDKQGHYCDAIKMRLKSLKGGLSGGTISSMATILSLAADDKEARKQMMNPYILNDDINPPKVRQDNIKKPQWDEKNKRWLAPFIMAAINTSIVHRSNQLLDYKYGRDFKYDEAMWMPAGVKGKAMSYAVFAGIAGFTAGMAFKPSRELLNDHILPKAGTGPSTNERENGRFDARFIGFKDDSKMITTKVSGDKDPGYESTCQMLAQSAICMLRDVSKQELAGGFWTPASAMGEKLIARLQDHTTISFEVIDS